MFLGFYFRANISSWWRNVVYVNARTLVTPVDQPDLVWFLVLYCLYRSKTRFTFPCCKCLFIDVFFVHLWCPLHFPFLTTAYTLKKCWSINYDTCDLNTYLSCWERNLGDFLYIEFSFEDPHFSRVSKHRYWIVKLL